EAGRKETPICSSGLFWILSVQRSSPFRFFILILYGPESEPSLKTALCHIGPKWPVIGIVVMLCLSSCLFFASPIHCHLIFELMEQVSKMVFLIVTDKDPSPEKIPFR